MATKTIEAAKRYYTVLGRHGLTGFRGVYLAPPHHSNAVTSGRTGTIHSTSVGRQQKRALRRHCAVATSSTNPSAITTP